MARLYLAINQENKNKAKKSLVVPTLAAGRLAIAQSSASGVRIRTSRIRFQIRIQTSRIQIQTNHNQSVFISIFLNPNLNPDSPFLGLNPNPAKKP